MNNKIGVHVHNLTNEVADALAHLQPRVVKVLDPSPQWVRDIRALVPGLEWLVVRKYEDGVPFYERSAVQWADENVALFGGESLLGVLFETYNEPFGHDAHHLFEPFDVFQFDFICILRTEYGADALTCCFGTGNFTGGPDRVRLDEAFPRTCELMHWLGPHDYDWPHIFKTEGWRALRWLKWLDDIEERFDHRPGVIVGEWGLTQATYGTGPDEGWRSSPEVNTTEYLNQMEEYNRRVCAIPECRAFLPFDWGGSGDYGWDSFEHAGDQEVISGIFRIACPGIPEPPPPTPPVEPPVEPPIEPPVEEPIMSDIKVTDRDYQERAFAWAQAMYGVTRARAQVAQGEKVYRLVALHEKTGPTSLITKVLDEDGNPIENADVALYWPGAEQMDAGQLYENDWYTNFVHGPTNAEGDVGPGMGGGAWIDVDPNPPHHALEGGPHSVWVRDPNVKSDICEGLGMRGGSPHAHLDQTFQRMTAGDAPTPPPTPEPPTPQPTGGGMFVPVQQDTPPTDHNHVQFELTEGSEKDFYDGIDTRVRVRVVNPEPPKEVWFEYPNVFQPERRKFDFEAKYTPGPDEDTREFQFQFLDILQDKTTSEWMGVVMKKGEFRRFDIKLVWLADVGPTPQPPTPQPPTPQPPTPPPTPAGDPKARLRQIAQEIIDLADQWPNAAAIAEVRVRFSDGTERVFKPGVVATVTSAVRRLIGGRN